MIFNRPDVTRRVFEQIKKNKPAFLYIAADGPRKGKLGEDKLCATTRSIVFENIDWNCEIVTLLRDENLGCGKAVSEAITWFFEHVEEGIILEDDCYPDSSFFNYCEELLLRYRYDDKIFSIGGTNLGYTPPSGYSYEFSGYMNMWGWATWRRASVLVDYKLSNWKSLKYKKFFLIRKLFKNQFPDFKWLQYWIDILNLTASGKLDTWDYQWIFTQWYYNKISIFSSKNLVQNLGFTGEATHTLDINHSIAKLPLDHLSFPLKHPKHQKANRFYEDKYIMRVWFGHFKQTLFGSVKTKLLYIPIFKRLNAFLKS
ncbi:MAG: hypothetical protein ABIP80_04975 [Ferruginibacter sp.]